MFEGEILTSLAAVLAGSDVVGAVPGHVLTLTVAALHGLGAVPDPVLTLAARTDKRFGAVVDEVTLTLAVAAALGTRVGTVLAHVALLLADVALAGEGAGVGAVGLVVTGCTVSQATASCFLCCGEGVDGKHTRSRRS